MTEADADTISDNMHETFRCKTPKCNGRPKRHPTRFRQPECQGESGKWYHMRAFICDTCGRTAVALVGVNTNRPPDETPTKIRHNDEA